MQPQPAQMNRSTAARWVRRRAACRCLATPASNSTQKDQWTSQVVLFHCKYRGRATEVTKLMLGGVASDSGACPMSDMKSSVFKYGIVRIIDPAQPCQECANLRCALNLSAPPSEMHFW